MSEAASLHDTLAALYQQDSRRVLATLMRLFNGNFDLAEEVMQEAFAAALQQWPEQGMPANPVAWLVSTGRFKAIDRLRNQSRFAAMLVELDPVEEAAEEEEPPTIEDDRLRLVFICCHPVLSEEARLALTLREVCGLTTEAIADAFLLPVSTLAQRIVRAKQKIREAMLPYEVPESDALPERLQSVLQVIYLMFNEGYTASRGDKLLSHDLSGEAIRLARLLLSLLPEPEVMGLLALMLLHDSRRDARISETGELVRLEDQDRNLWHQEQIDEGCRLVTQALMSRRFGPYTIQAAIAAIHAEAPDSRATDWSEVVGLYQVLLGMSPTPVVALNHAVAVSMYAGPREGLSRIDAILARGELTDYHLAHAARADCFRRLGDIGAARQAYEQALSLTRQETERRFLQSQLDDLDQD